MSEDCLTLNIWAPTGARKAPVFFWIHGGALTTGSSRDTLYDGTKLAERGIVVVSLNFRLGVLGWLAHPELSKESPLGISGNYALLDLIQGLKWVQQNIGAFGGDPSNVTIAGESSGGLSVMYLMASPPARGSVREGHRRERVYDHNSGAEKSCLRLAIRRGKRRETCRGPPCAGHCGDESDGCGHAERRCTQGRLCTLWRD